MVSFGKTWEDTSWGRSGTFFTSKGRDSQIITCDETLGDMINSLPYSKASFRILCWAQTFDLRLRFSFKVSCS